MKNLLIYSVGILFLSTLELYSQTAYYSQFSGNWTEANMWNSEPDGTGTSRTEPSNSPWGDPGINFVIQSGHELTLNGRTQVNKLKVEMGAKLMAGTGVLRYIEVFGDEMEVAGQMGNGDANDGISIDIAGPVCEISGGGTIDLLRLRKEDASSLPLAELTISTDINLRYNGTALYNGGIGVNAFHVTILEGVSVRILGKNGTPGDVSIDGVDGTNTANESFGVLTVNGILEVSGDLYAVSDNDQVPGLSGIEYVVNGLLKVGGKIYGNEGVGGDAMGRLQVNSGGELILAGGTDIFQDLNPSRNEINLALGSIFSYSGSTPQQVYDGLIYQTLKLSGGGDKVLTGDIQVEEKLILDSGNVLTGGEFALIINSTDPQAIDGGDESSYIIGNLRRRVTGGGSYFFPIGEEGTPGGYNPFSLNAGSGLVGEELVDASFSSFRELLDVERSCESEEGTRNLYYSCASGSWDINSNPFSYDISLFPSDETLNACTEESDFPTIRKTVGAEIQWGCDAGISGIPFSSFSSFSIAFAAELVAAPVELLFFEVQAGGSTAELHWMTSSESNNSHFVIERSENGEKFEEIAIVPGWGTTQEIQEYEYRDEHAGVGRKYYRLKQVDFNGDFEYFSIREVYLKAVLGAEILAAYPNPASKRYNLELFLPKSEKSTLVVSDLQGHSIYQAKLTHLQEGYNACHLDISGWLPGLYVYKIQAGEHQVQGKIIKI